MKTVTEWQVRNYKSVIRSDTKKSSNLAANGIRSSRPRSRANRQPKILLYQIEGISKGRDSFSLWFCFKIYNFPPRSKKKNNEQLSNPRVAKRQNDLNSAASSQVFFTEIWLTKKSVAHVFSMRTVRNTEQYRYMFSFYQEELFLAVKFRSNLNN